MEKAIKRSEEENPSNTSDSTAVKFFKSALKMLEKNEIPALEIIDENTTGLTDDKWDTLVYKEGTPNKTGVKGAAGGSFGIGKNAPYVASKLRLVCYSTRYVDKQRFEKFIARCKIIAHEDPCTGAELQHVGFGTSEKLSEKYFPPVTGKSIHEAFRLKNNGSGIYIVGFTEKDWTGVTTSSIANNFFVAIHEKKLIVNVDGYEINHETLNDIDFDDKNRRQYYEIIKNDMQTPHIIDEKFGKFELRLRQGSSSEYTDNRVAYINRKGMMITDAKSFEKNPFHARIGEVGRFMAVVRAADDDTDKRTRRMEPPNHETIEYKRLTDPAERKKIKENLKQIQKQITAYIKEELNINDHVDTLNLGELAKILPTPNGGEENGNGQGTEIEYKKRDYDKSTIQSGAHGGEYPADVGEDEGGSDETGTEEPTGKTTSEKKNKRAKKAFTLNSVGGIRMARHGKTLRLAFTPVTNTVRFVLRPAGEEYMEEEAVEIIGVKTISPSNVLLKDNIVTVNSKNGERVVMDVSLKNGGQYTAYNMEELVTAS